MYFLIPHAVEPVAVGVPAGKDEAKGMVLTEV